MAFLKTQTCNPKLFTEASTDFLWRGVVSCITYFPRLTCYLLAGCLFPEFCVSVSSSVSSVCVSCLSASLSFWEPHPPGSSTCSFKQGVASTLLQFLISACFTAFQEKGACLLWHPSRQGRQELQMPNRCLAESRGWFHDWFGALGRVTFARFPFTLAMRKWMEHQWRGQDNNNKQIPLKSKAVITKTISGLLDSPLLPAPGCKSLSVSFFPAHTHAER